MKDLKDLKSAAKNLLVLYVEDNDSLRENAKKLLNKFFDSVDTAVDGLDGLNKFKEHRHDLVITDIKMPNMDGISLAKQIRALNPDTKIIIMSAFNEKDYLIQAIELEVYRFLKKPVNLSEFTDVLYEVALQINKQKKQELFHSNIGEYFDDKNTMVAMLEKQKPISANRMFLNFFKVASIDEFIETYSDLGILFLEHKDFLYNRLDDNWFDVLRKNENRHYNVKIKDKNNKVHHLILRYHKIQSKSDFGILSLEDITELNLLNLFDKEQTKDENNNDTLKNYSVFELLKSIEKSGDKLELHNYYKGLSITNKATISKLKNDSVVVKTPYLQQKAIQFEKRTILSSQSLPYPIMCNEISMIGFEQQFVELKALKLIKTSPIERRTIRIEPEDDYTVSLFISEHEYSSGISIVDISLDSVKLKLAALPPGLNNKSKIRLSISLQNDSTPMTIDAKVEIFKKDEIEDAFIVVFIFKELSRNELVKYITKRQMAIIREFKGLQNG